MTALFAWTDGACSGNPGPGGWGVLMRAMEGDTVVKEREMAGGEALTTNNRMEMMAAIQALEALKSPCAVTLFTDSTYVMKGLTEWLPGWKRRGWKTAAGAPVKNQDLWQRLDAACQRHTLEWRWVKGHAGDAGNEAADALANQGLEAAR